MNWLIDFFKVFKLTALYQLFFSKSLSIEKFSFYLFVLCYTSEGKIGCTRVTRRIKNNTDLLNFFNHEMSHSQIKYTPKDNHFNYNEFEKKYNGSTMLEIYKKYNQSLLSAKIIFFLISLLFAIVILSFSIYKNNYTFTPLIAIVIVIFDLLLNISHFKILIYFNKFNKVDDLLEKGTKDNNLMLDYENYQIYQKTKNNKVASQIQESKNKTKEDTANSAVIKRVLPHISSEKDLGKQIEIIKNAINSLPVEKIEIDKGVPKDFKEFISSFINIDRNHNDIKQYFKPILQSYFEKLKEANDYNTLLTMLYFLLTDFSLKYKSLKYKEITLDMYEPYIKEIFTNVKSYKNIAHIISKLDEQLEDLEENVKTNKNNKEKLKKLYGIKSDLNKIQIKFLSLIPLTVYSELLNVNDDYELNFVN